MGSGFFSSAGGGVTTVLGAGAGLGFGGAAMAVGLFTSGRATGFFSTDFCAAGFAAFRAGAFAAFFAAFFAGFFRAFLTGFLAAFFAAFFADFFADFFAAFFAGLPATFFFAGFFADFFEEDLDVFFFAFMRCECFAMVNFERSYEIHKFSDRKIIQLIGRVPERNGGLTAPLKMVHPL
ncbi:MAG: hypothetical protein JST18_05645 [Bacteroidetes bacterium]|nr:hypothetical protein [Bacteroidota bacterium]